MCTFIFNSKSYSDESPLIPNEFLHEPHITAQDLGGEPILGLMVENEPDLWIHAVKNEVKRSLKEKQVYRFRWNCVEIVFKRFRFPFAASRAARMHLWIYNDGETSLPKFVANPEGVCWKLRTSFQYSQSRSLVSSFGWSHRIAHQVIPFISSDILIHLSVS